MYRNKRTKEDGFAGCTQVNARPDLGIATLQTFIAAASTNIALGSAFIAGYLMDISTCKVCIAEVAMIVSG